MPAPATIASFPRRIRHANAIAALQALFDYGRLSRAELARHLGLNRSSSGSIVAELLASGLVREVSDGEQKPDGRMRAGRPGILLELERQAAVFVGAEIGVEHITTLCINLAGEIEMHRTEPFDGRSVPVDRAVEKAIAQAFDELPAAATGAVEGFGLCAPAQLSLDGTVRIAPILGWRDVDLAALARTTLKRDVHVMVENDANAFAFGESYRDRLSKAGVTLFLVIETGVGGGIIIDGKLFRGSHGLAGEIGHVLIRERANLEQVLGRDHLLKRHAQATRRNSATFADFLNDVRDRAPKAVQIAEDWARDLAFALVASCRLIDPGRVVLGGSVAALYPLVAARVAHYTETAQTTSFPLPEIAVHRAAETGPAYGAACMLHQRFLSLNNLLVAESALNTDA